MTGAKPAVSQEAIEATYVVERIGRNRATVTREFRYGAPVVLARLERLRRSDWEQVAGCILADALDARPTMKLVRDYSRFIFVAPDSSLRLGGREIQEWLDTWDPAGLWGLFRGRR